MNANINHIKLLLNFKQQLFNYQDSLNEFLIRSGLQLMEGGYTLRFPDPSGTYTKDNQCLVDLHTIHRYLQNCPGLSLFGPNKYWYQDDIYIFTIENFATGEKYTQEVLIQEPFKQTLLLPFMVTGAWSLTLQLVKFGGNNYKAWQGYLDADYDARAINLMNKLPKDFGLPPLLRDLEFLQRVVTVYNQNQQAKKVVPLAKIIRQQIPAFRKQLQDLQYKLAILDQHQGQAVIYNFTNYSEFTPVVTLSWWQKQKISFRLWQQFFTI